MDLSSIRLFANLQNTDPAREKYLRPLAGLHAFFSRYRLTLAGQQCQDIIEYARHCETFNCFQSKHVRDMDDIESSANPRWDADYHDYANGLDVLVDINASRRLVQLYILTVIEMNGVELINDILDIHFVAFRVLMVGLGFHTSLVVV